MGSKLEIDYQQLCSVCTGDVIPPLARAVRNGRRSSRQVPDLSMGGFEGIFISFSLTRASLVFDACVVGCKYSVSCALRGPDKIRIVS